MLTRLRKSINFVFYNFYKEQNLMKKGLLDIYSDYLISQNHYATATGLAEVLDGEVSHDQVSRFLRAEDYGSKELWEYIKPDVRKQEQSMGGVLLLDDTIAEKHYTDENAVNCWHYSHAKHRHVKWKCSHVCFGNLLTKVTNSFTSMPVGLQRSVT
jgi:hypothetical protein